jgi:hypothetical protein
MMWVLLVLGGIVLLVIGASAFLGFLAHRH